MAFVGKCSHKRGPESSDKKHRKGPKSFSFVEETILCELVFFTFYEKKLLETVSAEQVCVLCLNRWSYVYFVTD